MLSKCLKKLSENEGYPIMSDVVRCTRFEEPVGFGFQQQSNVHVVTVPVAPETWSKEIHKELKKELKKRGTLVYVKAAHVLQLNVAGLGTQKIIRALEDGADALMAALKEKGVEIATTCHYCKQGGSDDYTPVLTYFMPVHSSCKGQEAQKILDKIEANETGGNLLLGILGALLGGIIGALPAVLVPVFTREVFPFLYFFIPLASYQGYRMLKGIMGSFTPFIVAVFSILSALFSEMLYFYLVLYHDRGIPFHIMVEDLFTGSYIKDVFFENAAFSLLACVVGIAMTWGVISKGNKQLRREAEALAQSASDTVEK